MTNYSTLDLEQVIYIHERIIDVAGGKQGIRDYTVLHSGLERCKATFAGRDLFPATLEKAAALMHSLVKNHAFLDGNKRTAYAITVRFLEENGYEVKVSQQEIIDFCLAIDNHGWDLVEIVKWLSTHFTQSKK
jgi:death-on-curing protein